MTRQPDAGPMLSDVTMVRRRNWSVTVAVVALSVGAGWGLRHLQNAGSAAPDASNQLIAGPAATKLSPGAVLFQVHCAKCHGSDGRGDAEAMARLHPPPRDFAERPWRFEMTRDSIRRVIADGIPGTAMAGQRAALNAGELETLAEHVLVMVKQLPAIQRTFTPEQQQLAAIGFDVERQPSPAPGLTVADSQGVSLSLADLRGSWVLLEFWGVSCEPCLKAMPALQRLSVTGVGERVRIVTVCADTDDAEAAQAHLSRIALGLTAHVEAAGLGIAAFSVQALPMTWLIDPDGHVCGTRVGSIDWDSPKVREAFAAAVARDSAEARSK